MLCVKAHIALALLLIVPGGSPAASPAVVEITAASAEQLAHAEWALARFAAADLELPALRIVFHDGYEACGMREGVLAVSGDGMTIHECEPDPARLRRSLLHELAHAWDVSGGIAPAARDGFLARRNLDAWRDDSLEWQQRGEEQAAEIIAWGLGEQAAPIATRVREVGDQDPGALAEAFLLLTGRAPLFGTASGAGN